MKSKLFILSCIVLANLGTSPVYGQRSIFSYPVKHMKAYGVKIEDSIKINALDLIITRKYHKIFGPTKSSDMKEYVMAMTLIDLLSDTGVVKRKFDNNPSVNFLVFKGTTEVLEKEVEEMDKYGYKTKKTIPAHWDIVWEFKIKKSEIYKINPDYISKLPDMAYWIGSGRTSNIYLFYKLFTNLCEYSKWNTLYRFI